MQQSNKIFGDFSQNLMDNRILNIKITNFHPESRGMTIFGKSPCQKSGQIAFILP